MHPVTSVDLDAVRRSNADLWLAKAVLHGSPHLEQDGLVVFTTGFPPAYWNGGIVAGRLADPPAAFATVRRFFADRGVQYGCLVPAELLPDYVGAAAAAGLTPEEQPLACMAAAVADVADVATPPGLAVRPVRTAYDLGDHVGVVSEAFEEDPGLLTRFVGPEVGSPGWTHLTGYVGGRPVSAATAWSHQGMAAVLGVATIAGVRRRGYAAALTTLAVRAVQRAGATTVWLNPSRMAHGCYRRMGFLDLPGWAILAPGG